jgi:hypothetical protein
MDERFEVTIGEGGWEEKLTGIEGSAIGGCKTIVKGGS